MNPEERESLERQATKLTLASVFLGVLMTFSARLARRGEEVTIRPFDLLLLGLSTYRTGRLVAYERVAEPIRQPFTDVISDESGAGDTVVASGRGARWVIGELLSCPICIGTWVSAGLVCGLHVAPIPTRLYLAVMGTTGVAQLFHESTEALSWSARAARHQAGNWRG